MSADQVITAEADRMARARAVITGGIAARAYPASVIEVGRAGGPIWREAFGHLSYEDGAPTTQPDTVFDLASLTKVIATTSLTMAAVRKGRLALLQPVAEHLASWRSGERALITVEQLLNHSSGLPEHVRLFERARGRAEFERAIGALPLERTPGTASVYSDVGFMLLGFLLEDVGNLALDRQFAPLASDVGDVRFLPPAAWRARTAPTEVDAWRGRVLQGEVHDENAAALGGVAGHAGLFGSAGAVGRFAQLALRTFTTPTQLGSAMEMRRFAARSSVPGSSRGLGWDTMLPTSSCGTLMSPRAIGHTGFTGTSLWIDPENDVYVVWLTNRVHPTRSNEAFAPLRPKLHDAVMQSL